MTTSGETISCATESITDYGSSKLRQSKSAFKAEALFFFLRTRFKSYGPTMLFKTTDLYLIIKYLAPEKSVFIHLN